MNVEEELKKIIERVIELPQRDRIISQELLEHREWGVALEHLCATIVEERIQISMKIYKNIELVSREMEIWDDIREQLRTVY